QDSVKAWLPGAAPLSVADALRLCANANTSSHDWSEAVPALAEEALTALLSAREREGSRLAAMVLDRAKQLRALAQQAVPLVPQLVEQQRQRFMERWKEAMALTDGAVLPEAARDRALTEATAFAIRIDVAEEITRLESHLDEIERLLKKGGEVGKRLDFLIQELHREANTLGSKSAALDLTRISVDMKVLIEQMREQVQNIE
ncbi:MAG: YicC family protein, partial [Pseudomonas sp.]